MFLTQHNYTRWITRCSERTLRISREKSLMYSRIVVWIIRGASISDSRPKQRSTAPIYVYNKRVNLRYEYTWSHSFIHNFSCTLDAPHIPWDCSCNHTSRAFGTAMSREAPFALIRLFSSKVSLRHSASIPITLPLNVFMLGASLAPLLGITEFSLTRSFLPSIGLSSSITSPTKLKWWYSWRLFRAWIAGDWEDCGNCSWAAHRISKRVEILFESSDGKAATSSRYSRWILPAAQPNCFSGIGDPGSWSHLRVSNSRSCFEYLWTS